MEDTYQTITQTSEGIYKEKGSKFLAFAFPINSEDEIKWHIDTLKKEYFDARHHCYAYIWGFKQEHYRANDDGEPNNSAGIPILGQIRSKNLTNVLIVVVRYFGGIKLGVSGLIKAYKTAAFDALENAVIIDKQIQKHIHICFDYVQMNQVMKLVKDYEMEIIHQKMDLDCELECLVREGIVPEIQSIIEKMEVKSYRIQ
jgi:uncharacterized YigZ family protein